MGLANIQSLLMGSALNLALRVITLFGKFIFLFVVAKYYSPEDLGIYGLVFAAIATSVLFIGMEFYSFNNRHIATLKPKDTFLPIRDQAVFHLLIYLITLPLLYGLFLYKLLPISVLLWFYVLLILEHICTELYRLMIVLDRPLEANTNLFIRSASWMYAICALVVASDSLAMLSSIWIAWSMGEILCLFYSLYILRNIGWEQCFSKKINWQWIKQGVMIAFPLYLASLSLKLIEFSDRFFIKFFHGLEAVGIYTFYASTSMVIQSFVFAGAVTISLPKLLKHQSTPKVFSKHVRDFKILVLAIALVVSIGLAIFIHPVLYVIGKDIYTHYLSLFWATIGMNLLVVVSWIAHYQLYALKQDKVILFSTLTSMLIILGLHYLLIPKMFIYGAIVANICGISIMCAMKYVALYSIKQPG